MDYRIKNIKGNVYGRLTAIQYVSTRKGGAYWLFKCDCGNEKVINASSVRAGKVSSCGCLAKEVISKNFKKHGKAKTRTYNIWVGIKQRCLNPNNCSYSNYGGRGITICSDWLSFDKFFEDMGEAPDGLSIERIDNNEGYSKDNCEWADRSKQNTNKSYKNKSTGIRNISYSDRDDLYYVGVSKDKKRHRKSFKKIEDAILWRDSILKEINS